MHACYAKSHAVHSQNAKDVKQEVAKMPHAIDALESNAMLWVAQPLVEQLCKTFLQAAGRGSVRAVALGPLVRSKALDVFDGIKACISFCNQRHASERKWRVARIRTLSLSADRMFDMRGLQPWHATETGVYAGGHLGATCGWT